MSRPVRLAVVGLGRIGRIHAQHTQELSLEEKSCELTAVVDTRGEHAAHVAGHFQARQGVEIHTFTSVSELVASGSSDGAIVCSPTESHRRNARELVEAGQRVLLEKPLTGSVDNDREFASYLGEHHKHSVMLAFQRRFDEALEHGKSLLEQGCIGTPFKIVSILEDSRPPPDGYNSPGLLADMSVHNIDEVLWLSGARPVRIKSIGSRLYNHRVSTVGEDLDDALIYMWFEGDLAAQVQVSRNHVSGYRTETWIYGDGGMIHVGRFNENRRESLVEVYDRETLIERRSFALRDYGRAVPEFADRFGPAYKNEVAYFVRQCEHGEPFCVDQNDGLAAMEVAAAGNRSLETGAGAVLLRGKPHTEDEE